ncbi:MAG: ATP-binding protein [Spirochaetales bacterium]|nr:ATP-binding protein [Spirochaetales bacterium]
MRKIQKKADMVYFDAFLDFVDSCSVMVGFDKKDENKIRLACEEIIINIMKYAYPKSKGDITIRCDIQSGKSLTINIIDQGIEFNPLETEEPDIDSPVQERKIGGLGIFMVKKIMDSLEYQRIKDTNILTLKKSLIR